MEPPSEGRRVRFKTPPRPPPGLLSVDARDPLGLIRAKEGWPGRSRKQAANRGSAMRPLAEKYRPQTWADAIGQDNVVRRLKAINSSCQIEK
jgi:hypothetical protein